LITALEDSADVHPAALVTVKLYVFVASPVMVVLVPLPVMAPGFMVHIPVEGKPLNTTLPVAIVQPGCVMVPMVGAEGVEGCELITTFSEAGELHPDPLVTVKLYVSAVSPVMDVLVPVPVIAPGLMVQVPDAGKPPNMTLPVETVQVGCVMVPTAGAAGVDRCALITTSAETGEMHPAALVTVKL